MSGVTRCRDELWGSSRRRLEHAYKIDQPHAVSCQLKPRTHKKNVGTARTTNAQTARTVVSSFASVGGIANYSWDARTSVRPDVNSVQISRRSPATSTCL